MCDTRFQKFVSCVDEILQLHDEANDLEKNLKHLDNELQISGKKYLGKGREFVSSLKILENSRKAKQTLKFSLIMLQKIKQIQSSFEKKVQFIHSNFFSNFVKILNIFKFIL